MFDHLTEKLEAVFKNLRSRGKLTEANVEEALREVRRALLEADVNYKVAKSFVHGVKTRALGQDVLKSITPGQQIVKAVHGEMVKLLGGSHEGLQISGSPPNVVLMIGLQGSGKTTTAAKLARLVKSMGRRPLLVAADVTRPAAVEQLTILGESIEVAVQVPNETNDPVKTCVDGLARAKTEGLDPVIMDTAGRLHVDEDRMDEAARIKEAVDPSEILFIADGMTGQDAVSTAAAFHERLQFTGVVLTRMDSDTRGGAAVSIREVTGVPIKFVGVSEKLEGLEPFHPERMASRIMGMGDVVTLVEKAEQAVEVEQARKLQKKLRTASFTFDDFREQLDQVRKMGPLDQVMQMIPGAGKALKGVQVTEDAFVQVEAVICSMTRQERANPQMLNGSRRRRIARGSGTKVQDINRLIKQFNTMQKMMKRMGRGEMVGKGLSMPF